MEQFEVSIGARSRPWQTHPIGHFRSLAIFLQSRLSKSQMLESSRWHRRTGFPGSKVGNLALCRSRSNISLGRPPAITRSLAILLQAAIDADRYSKAAVGFWTSVSSRLKAVCTCIHDLHPTLWQGPTVTSNRDDYALNLSGGMCCCTLRLAINLETLIGLDSTGQAQFLVSSTKAADVLPDIRSALTPAATSNSSICGQVKFPQ